MYQLVYYYKETTGKEVIERQNYGEEFRLRRNALHYLLEITQSIYRENGYGTEQIVGGINCYKSEKTDSGERKTIEMKIKIEKVGQ